MIWEVRQDIDLQKRQQAAIPWCASLATHSCVINAATVSVLSFSNELSSASLPPKEEECEAKSLEDRAYGSNKPTHERDIGLPLGRIKLHDLKLQTVDSEPVILGQGGFGKVNNFLDWSLWLLNLLHIHIGQDHQPKSASWFACSVLPCEDVSANSSAQVYLGKYFRAECAIKVVTGSTRNEQASFLREIKLLEQLASEHITRYLGFGVVGNGLVMLMEYMPGYFSPPSSWQFCILVLVRRSSWL